MLICLGPACGYHFSVGAGSLPSGGQQLAIGLADNRNVEGWTAAEFTAGLRIAAERVGLLVVDDDGSAPCLHARVVYTRVVPRGVAALGGSYRTREQEVIVRVELSLVEGGKQTWETAVSDRQSFLSAPDLRGTEANRQMATRAVLQRVAERSIERLTRNF